MVNEPLNRPPSALPAAFFHRPLTKKMLRGPHLWAEPAFTFTLCYCVGRPGARPGGCQAESPDDLTGRQRRRPQMDSIVGTEGSLLVRFVVAFVIVLALIGITFWLIRRFGGARIGSAAQRGRAPRLAVIDAAAVDGRRRLVLVRRDNVEHLLMIGGPSDIVVEQNIVRAVPVNAPRDVPAPRAAGMS